MFFAFRPSALVTALIGSLVLVALEVSARADGPLARSRGSQPARVDETQACIDASDGGQTLRIDKHLRAARDQFALCARRECPGEIRSRCAAWLDETERGISAVVFVVKDEAGSDVDPVRITVDGAAVTPRYDGSALPFDPGEHLFRFEADGRVPLERTLRLAQGERDRRERVVLASVGARSMTAKTEAPSSGAGIRTAGLVGAGLGVAGIVAGGVLGILAIADNDNAHCSVQNVCADPQSRRDAQGVALGSTVGFIAGGALLAGGIALFLVAPKSHPRAVSLVSRVMPLVSAGAAGVAFVGTW